MKRLSVLITSIFLFASCDRIGKYQFQINNDGQKQITVTFQHRDNDSLQARVINAGDSAIIITSGTEILGLNEKPHGVWNNSDTIFAKLQITVDSKIFDKDYRMAKEWTYKAVNRKIGLYKLIIRKDDE